MTVGIKNNSCLADSNIPESNVGLIAPTEPNLPPAENIIKPDENAIKADRLRKKIQADEAKDALVVKRLRNEIQKASDTIELDKKQLEVLSWPYRPPYHWPYRREELLNILDLAKERWQLLDSQEKNCNKIINLVERYRVPGVDITDIKKTQAEKYHILGIDIISEKKKLIECQERKREMELATDSLQKKIEQIDNDYLNSKRKK